MSQHSEDTGVPSAQVPGVTVEASDVDADRRDDAAGHPASTVRYGDGNLDDRGVMPSGRPQVDHRRRTSLDDQLDTTPRTDRRGQAAVDTAR